MLNVKGWNIKLNININDYELNNYIHSFYFQKQIYVK